MASASIKVSVRCRPFSKSDTLGVMMHQTGDEEGEVELINCDYQTTRFPFSYSWWSAYGYEKYIKPDGKHDAATMQLVDQSMAYNSVGLKIKEDLLSGNAVVLFAYGLSGSGKTFTVFGPDAHDAPEAWFKHATPQPLWGIFPRLAYEIFEMKKEGWKISMKYFQNVVDTVRDLMSSSGEEQHYKNGMRKDPDGFMDIEWCTSKVISSWNDLRETFLKANARKAIAATQFNAMSTRGHCILVLEVEMPNPENPELKTRGRLYVCDLAGTEPAGDIFSAQYDRIPLPNGSFEYKLIGPHQDQKKTKELQDQGKKINLSLSEMAQFFMKMAEAVQKKTLQPGVSIPGCNSFFLCKYLKDTMLQAKTYLFCAVRPEVDYLRYTFATLGFAKNASVVQLKPKKATVSASAAERKLMEELEKMKELVSNLQKQGSSNNNAEIEELKRQLAEKQAQESGETEALSAEKKQQIEEYAKRGISIAEYEDMLQTNPYFSNLDEDAFRSDRFMYILKKPEVVFGSKGDIQLMSLMVVKDHCKVTFDGTETRVYAGKGDTYHNGVLIPKDSSQKVEVFDRLAMGDQLMMFRWPHHEEGKGEPCSAEYAVEEFQNGLQAAREAEKKAGTSQLDEERKRIFEERAKWEQEKSALEQEKEKLKEARDQERSAVQIEKDKQAKDKAMSAVNNQIVEFLPKAKEAKQLVDLLSRITMNFDVVLDKGSDGVPNVKISVLNSNPKYSIVIDPQEFLPKLSLLKDEMMKLRSALDGSREYEIPTQHDPLYLMFDNDFHLGTSTIFPEYLLYNLETEDEEMMNDIKNAAHPFNNVGLLSVKWIPLGGPNDGDENKPILEIEDEKDLIGKPWTYQLVIQKATDLPVYCENSYVEYEFFGEAFTTECVQQNTFSPLYDYKRIHHVPKVTQEFIDFLKGSMELKIHITQHIDAPKEKIATTNKLVADSIISGEAKAYTAAGTKPKSEAELRCEKLEAKLQEAINANSLLEQKISSLSIDPSGADLVKAMEAELERQKAENARMSKLVLELETKIGEYEPGSKVASKLQTAIMKDSIVNG